MDVTEDPEEEEELNEFALSNDLNEAKKLFPVVSLEVAHRFFNHLNLSDCELKWVRIRNMPILSREKNSKFIGTIRSIDANLQNLSVDIQQGERILRYFLLVLDC